jgi:hypothetical protein
METELKDSNNKLICEGDQITGEVDKKAIEKAKKVREKAVKEQQIIKKDSDEKPD